MAYDVFLVSALEDREIAKLVARRLRALKFRVWLDQKQVDDTFDQKDARDALNSQSMVVLWSEKAVESDWVRAAASVGRSREGMLVQLGLDDTIPYEPFSVDKRYDISNMTSRTTPEPFYEVVTELGRRDGRKDLVEYMGFGSKDDEARAAWYATHLTDPLSLAYEKRQQKALLAEQAEKGGSAIAASVAALGAATLAASAATTDTTKTTVEADLMARAARTQNEAYGQAASAAAVAPAPIMVNEEMESGGGWLIPLLLALIGLMLLAAYLVNKRQAPVDPTAVTYLVEACPAGHIPSNLLADYIEPRD